MADEDQPHAARGDEIVEDAQHLFCTVTSSAEVGSSAIRRSGSADQHHGDHHALAHAAGELVRIEAKTRSGSRMLHRFEHRERALLGLARALARRCRR